MEVSFEIKEIKSEEELNKIIKHGMSLIIFCTSWSACCRLQDPILLRLALRFQENASIASVNLDLSQEIARTLGIQSVPTLILFKNSKEIQRFVGIQSEETLSSTITKLIK